MLLVYKINFMGAEENKPFDLTEFVQSIFDKIKIKGKRDLFIWVGYIATRVSLIPDSGKAQVYFSDNHLMGTFEPYGPGDATQGYLCKFIQKYRKGMKTYGLTQEEEMMMNIVKGNEYIRFFPA